MTLAYRPKGRLRSLSPAEIFHRFQPVVDLALAQYDIENPRYEFLHYRDGVTFFVEPLYLLGKYVLRIHNPARDYQKAWHQREVIESGLRWLEAIDQDGILSTQKPVRNIEGELVTEVTPLRHSGEPYLCTVLHWVEGTGGKEIPGRTLAHIRQIGQIMAQLHQHSIAWERPADFVRPKFDAEELEAAIKHLRQITREGRLSRSDYALFDRAAQRAMPFIDGLERNEDSWGLIHGDLGHRGNCVYFRNQVHPIDFNGCLLSFFLLDLAWAFLYIEGSKRQSFIDGYTSVRPLPADYRTAAEHLYIGAQINLFSRYAQEGETSLGYARRFAARECRSYLEGRSFLMDRAWWES